MKTEVIMSNGALLEEKQNSDLGGLMILVNPRQRFRSIRERQHSRIIWTMNTVPEGHADIYWLYCHSTIE